VWERNVSGGTHYLVTSTPASRARRFTIARSTRCGLSTSGILDKAAASKPYEHFLHESSLRAYYRRDFGAGVRVTERMASSSERAAPSYPSHGFIFCSRAAALCTVNRLGSNRRLTSFQ
jgi:hypothetical protein